MASNLQKTSALLEQTALNVTKSPEAWMAFLNTAARVYKLSIMGNRAKIRDGLPRKPTPSRAVSTHTMEER